MDTIYALVQLENEDTFMIVNQMISMLNKTIKIEFLLSTALLKKKEQQYFIQKIAFKILETIYIKDYLQPTKYLIHL
ncbi:unnamed protein product [Paramecium primaurelia]|uniref:Uncharacterized protein n=1 Tax=Paramecium primaurelia TaxID=5886 RepID=A0A8S1MES1_PARPR|nr:unnamed protein product [Paramecium primaurelia]